MATACFIVLIVGLLGLGYNIYRTQKFWELKIEQSRFQTAQLRQDILLVDIKCEEIRDVLREVGTVVLDE